MGSDDEGPKRATTRTRAKRNTQNEPLIPTTVVCSPSQATSQRGAIELGAILSLAVLALCLYGTYNVASSLPDPPRFPNTLAHLGENWNVAKNVFSGNGRVSSNSERKTISGVHAAANENGNGSLRRVKSGDITLPPSHWPVSVKDDTANYETIIHPGNQETKMLVPKFWSPPIHNNGLMTREAAMKIGSCIEADSHGNHARGEACPVHQRTVHVAIASYRDFECRTTVESIFLNAKHPERIRVGVVDQIVDGEDPICNAPVEPCEDHPEQALCLYQGQIDVYQMEAELSIGPVFARHIGYRLYRGEYYATQSDAHVSYTRGWDVDIISQLESTKNDMAVLTTYLTDVQESIDKNGDSLRKTRPIMCNTIYEGGPQGMHLRHASQPERLPSVHGTPQLQPWWAAGYSFSRGHFVVNVPYDYLQPMIFQGEEMSIGIRGYTIGYDYYAPERSVCFHHYAVGKNARKRGKVHHFWENDRKYAGTGKKAMSRLLGIVHMNPEISPDKWDHTDEELYGIGGVRTPEKFYEIFGIDVTKKTVEGHLCSFVHDNGRMHNKFTPRLRPDGMGIDYSGITYKFKDPWPGNAAQL